MDEHLPRLAIIISIANNRNVNLQKLRSNGIMQFDILFQNIIIDLRESITYNNHYRLLIIKAFFCDIFINKIKRIKI